MRRLGLVALAVAQRLYLAANAIGIGTGFSGLFYDDEVRRFFGLAQSGWEVMHEVAFGARSFNPVIGQARNPYDLARVPGATERHARAMGSAGILVLLPRHRMPTTDYRAARSTACQTRHDICGTRLAGTRHAMGRRGAIATARSSAASSSSGPSGRGQTCSATASWRSARACRERP